MRREFPAKVKLAAFQRANGKCEKCGAKLFTGKFHYDHRIADAMGGEPTVDNCDVLCTACHAIKTPADLASIAKAKRVKARHIGIPRSSNPMAGGRRSPWKRKMDGTTERRT